MYPSETREYRNRPEIQQRIKASRRKYLSTANGRALVAAGNKRHGERRTRLLNRIKLDAGCVDCGYNDHPSALDFDHKDGQNKSFNIGVDRKRSLVSVLTEIEKCEVRCSNCHRIRTAESRGWTVGI